MEPLFFIYFLTPHNVIDQPDSILPFCIMKNKRVNFKIFIIILSCAHLLGLQGLRTK